MDTPPAAARPYRSHRVPACDRCRKRKIRCKIELPGRPCELCAERGFDCLFSRPAAPRPSTAHRGLVSSERPHKRPGLGHPRPPPTSEPCRPHAGPLARSPTADRPDGRNRSTEAAQRHAGSTPAPGSQEASASSGESSIVVGPMVAEDVHILQQYLASEPRTSPRPRQPYNVVSNAPGNPMIYLAVPGRRERLKWAKDPGHDQREILEQILGPKKRDVIELYFTHIHPAFPVLDEEEFIRADGDAVSSALLCEVYAISLTFWDVSGLLKHQHCPSDQYFWNLAIAALQDDFLSPNLLTLYASVVDLLGRPVGSVQGNVVNAGRAMALAYSLGLNRDPSAWKFADRDKRLRMRLFWGCMVLDQWYDSASRLCNICTDKIRSSFAHGIPPSITRKQHDVPLPSVTVLLTPGNESDDRIKAAECFIQLCKLSQILGDVLSYVYDLSEQHKGIWKELRRLECDLDEWEGGLPEHLQAEALENSTSVSGASSLHLGYLSVRMLLCRVSLRAASWEDTLDAGDIRQYHMTTLRRAATRITDFVVSLRSCQLKEFWLSFTGHLLVASATVLLRCAIDTSDATVAKGCKESLRSLQKRLHLAKAQDDWDLADMFIKRCDEPITRIITEPPPGSRENRSNTARYLQDQEHSQGQMEVQDVFDFTQSTYSDFHVSMGTVDHPWESLWDMLEGP